MNRLSLYVFYDRNGKLRDFDKYYLNSLSEISDTVVLVNGLISSEDREFLKSKGYAFVCRDNVGFDFAAWKEYFAVNIKAISSRYDEVILCNCSCYGPVFPFERIFSQMSSVECDFWGLCRHPGANGRYPAHLQSYFLVLRSRLFKDSSFIEYFNSLKTARNWQEAVNQETHFTKYFEDKGFTAASFIDDSLSKIYPDASIILPERLLELGFPFVKRKVFSVDYSHIQSYTDGTYIRAVLDFLRNRTSYPVDLIKKDILNSLPNSQIRNVFHLTYALDSKKADSSKQNLPESKSSVAAILFSYYEDLVEQNIRYLSALPKNCHLFIVVLSEKMKNLWEQRLKPSGYKYEIRMQRNRGRNEAAYWLTCRDVIHDFDYICLIHDKKTPSAHPPVRGVYFAGHCLKNVLFSEEYVLNVIRLFDSHPDLGLLMPTVPMFGDWPNLILNREWGRNREVAKEVYDRLKLGVPFDEHPAAPWGAMFWIRGLAMAAFYRYSWTPDDFPEEPIKVTDGTVLHAMERMYPMIAQESGYLSAWIVPSCLIGTYYDNLYSKTLEYKAEYDTRRFQTAPKQVSSNALPAARWTGASGNEPLFFPEGYLEMYPDVARKGVDPWHHYVRYGKKEGRDNGNHPDESQFFAAGYLEEYPDVAKAGVDPWKHYVSKGKNEGRDNGLHPAENVFFADGYLEMYPDVAESGVDPWKHYVKEGKKEGRDNGLHPNENVFFAPGYLELYHDVVENGFEPWHHYVEYGKQEGRENGTGNVDSDFYLSMYPDVRSAGISPVVHYFKYGKKEHRFPNYESLNKNDKDLELIRQSKYFDHNWYLNEYPNCCKDPAVDYYIKFQTRNPSVNFISNDYYRLNKDVECSGMNPLVHFEKYGKSQNRPMVLTFEHNDVFNADLVEIDGINCKTLHAVNKTHTIHNKVLVFAAYCKDGLLHEYRRNLLHELRQYCDYLVFVSDNPMMESEVRNCHDIDAFICKRHHRYDFGSYIYGIELLSKLDFLDGQKDLVLCNDSCLGPVCSFSPVFSKYDLNKDQIDFYGLSVSNDYRKHKFIQSFFIIFAPSVYQSEIFKNVFNLYNIPAGIYFSDVGVNCEGELTYVLTQAGFTYKTFVDENSVIKRYGSVRPTNKPLELITVYGYPLIKRKFLIMNKGTIEYEDLVGYLKREKRDFWNSIVELITNEQKKAGTIVNKNIYKPIDYSFVGVRNHYSELVPKIQNRIKSRGFIKVDFLIANLSMLAYRSLIHKMLKDQRFRVRVWIIPDTRWMKVDTLTEYRKCLKDLTSIYGKDVVMPAVHNPESAYPVFINIFSDEPDVVFYPTPYDLSYTPYNIPNAIRYDVLSAYINYGFPRNKYCEEVFKRTNYCNLWKVFLETQFQLDDYIKNGFVNGDNAVVAGYSKIDELYDLTQKLDLVSAHTYNGKVYDKVVILAPHHSLEGGFNATMHLSNFLKYADFFQKLPGKFKNILFVFRPHPALFLLLKQDRFWGEQKSDEYLKTIQKNDNLILSTEGDYFHWFAASDAMIHDCGSFTVEYLYTDKPCCYMLKSEDEIEEQFNDFGKQCLDCYCHALNEDDIVRFIEEEVLQGKDSKKSIRTKFAHEVLMKDYPHSSEKIMNCLADSLMPKNQVA